MMRQSGSNKIGAHMQGPLRGPNLGNDVFDIHPAAIVSSAIAISMNQPAVKGIMVG